MRGPGAGRAKNWTPACAGATDGPGTHRCATSSTTGPRSKAAANSCYFERVIGRNPRRGGWAVGGRLTYVDLSLFQIVEGFRYAFPQSMARVEAKHLRLVDVRDRVAARPNIAAYLASERRIAFNERGIFRNYPELEK